MISTSCTSVEKFSSFECKFITTLDDTRWGHMDPILLVRGFSESGETLISTDNNNVVIRWRRMSLLRISC